MTSSRKPHQRKRYQTVEIKRLQKELLAIQQALSAEFPASAYTAWKASAVIGFLLKERDDYKRATKMLNRFHILK